MVSFSIDEKIGNKSIVKDKYVVASDIGERRYNWIKERGINVSILIRKLIDEAIYERVDINYDEKDKGY